MARNLPSTATYEAAQETSTAGMRASTEVDSSSVQVLHLHSGNMIGGIETMLLTLAEYAHFCPELKQSFALTFDSEFAADLRSRIASVDLLPEVRLRYPPSIYQARRQLRILLKRFPFDVAISHSAWIQLIFGDVLKGFGIPVVFWMHDAFDGHWLQRLASFHVPDLAIANSRWTMSSLERCYPRVRGTVLYPPVSPRCDRCPRREEIRAALGIRPEEVLILMAARMDRWKGHLNLVRAADKIRTAVPWRIMFAGGANTPEQSAYVESLRREVAKSGLAERVQFLGFRSDVPALISASDILCQSNEKPEPYGFVFLEALQAGVPIVTYAMGGAREILDESVSILVQPGAIDRLADALVRVIEEPTVRVRLGSAGPQRVRVLSDPQRQMQRLAEILKSVVARGREAAAS